MADTNVQDNEEGDGEIDFNEEGGYLTLMCDAERFATLMQSVAKEYDGLPGVPLARVGVIQIVNASLEKENDAKLLPPTAKLLIGVGWVAFLAILSTGTITIVRWLIQLFSN